MISTKGIELTNFINPDLTWKTVAKGYRSATRRSRKQVDRSPKSDADLVDRGMESPSDTTVSESEKLGVAVLGQRFSDKSEPVPIKKRRLTVRSQSPPRYFSPNNKNQELIGHAKQSCKKAMSKKQLFAVDASTRRRKATRNHDVDFFNIEMLAKTACDNVSLVTENPAQKDRDQSSVALPPKELILSAEITRTSQLDAVIEDAKEGSISHIELGTSHDVEQDDQKNVADQKSVEKSASSRDVRLHWDLNVEMDAWETPSETVAHRNDKLQVLEACEVRKESKDSNVDVVATAMQSTTEHIEERLESSSCIDGNEEKIVPTGEAIVYSTCGMVAETSQNVASDSLASNSSCLVSENVSVAVLSAEPIEKSYVKLDVKEMENDPAITAQLGINAKLDVSACKMEITLLSENGDSKLPQEMASSSGSHSLVPVRKAEEVGMNVGEAVVHESKGDSRANPAEVLQKSSGSSARAVAAEVTKHGRYVLNAGNSKYFETGYDSQYEDGELRESDAPPYWEEDNEECVDYGSDTCDDATAFSMPSKFGMEADCSEDDFGGRERSLDRNANVDRGFGYGYDGVSEHGVARDSLRQKPVSIKIKMSGPEEVPRCSVISTNAIAEEPEGCLISKQTADSSDGFDGKGSPTKVVIAGQPRKELSGTGEPLISSDTAYRNDSAVVQRTRTSNFDFYDQPEEARSDFSMGRERSDLQVHPKSPVGIASASGSSYWDSRRRESSPFRGSFGGDRSRLRNAVESRGGYAMHSEGGGVVSGTDNYGNRQTMNSFSNGSYRYPIRRRSPVNRDEPYNTTHRGIMPMRDGSPDRRRFRRYPQGVGRGFREYHQRPMPPNDSDEYSHHMPNRMVRRDQNSPPPNRGHVYYRRPYKRSQSRSRSRSPGEWVVSRDQHDVPKHRNNSRSPDFRFDNRMQRMRMPFQKQNFGAKYEVGFMSPQRRRFSPHHNNNNNNSNYRWFDDQNGGSDFRGRRVPGRPFQPGQRFDSVGSSRRMNSDDYYEPAMRPARFSEMGRGRGGGVGVGGGGGGSGPRRYEGSDDERRRPEGRYENQMYPRVKRCDSDGLRRIRVEEEDSFVSRNSNNNYNDSDNNNIIINNNNNIGGERRPRTVYVEELVKRKAN